MSDVCDAPQCDRPRKTRRRWCSMHASRMDRRGSLEALKPRRTERSPCSVAACDLVSIGHAGLCSKHYARLVRYGSATAERAPGRRPRIADPSYRVVHARLARDRGSASAHPCSADGCERVAQDWAYDHEDADERRDDRGRVYSVRAQHYRPLCRPHHRSLDRVTE